MSFPFRPATSFVTKGAPLRATSPVERLPTLCEICDVAIATRSLVFSSRRGTRWLDVCSRCLTERVLDGVDLLSDLAGHAGKSATAGGVDAPSARR